MLCYNKRILNLPEILLNSINYSNMNKKCLLTIIRKIKTTD